LQSSFHSQPQRKPLAASQAGRDVSEAAPPESSGNISGSQELGSGSSRKGLQRSKEIVERVLDLLNQAEIRGAKHIHITIDVLDTLADIFVRLGDLRAASTTYGRALATAKQLFAADHERCAILQHRLSEALVANGHYDDAYHLLRELQGWCELCPAGRMPPIPLVVIQHSLANCLRLMERFGEAEALYLQALASKDGVADFDTRSMMLGNLAAMRLTTGDVPGAIRLNQEALTLRLGHHGPANLDVAASYGNLADLSLRAGLLADAVAYADKCMTTVECALLPDSAKMSTGAKKSPAVLQNAAGRQQQQHAVHSGSYDGSRPETRNAKADGLGSRPRLPTLMHHPFYVMASGIKAGALRELKTSQFRKVSHTSKGQPSSIALMH
jgi:tetratricopeptide (TPR) repeat protein